MKIATVLTLGFLTGFLLPVSQTFAGVTNDAPLAPGKPAGVHQAQFENGNGMLVVAGAAAIGIAIALATADNGVSAIATTPGGGSTSSSTSATGTSP